MKIVTIKSSEKIPPFAQVLRQYSVEEQEGDFSTTRHFIELLVPEESDWEFLAIKLETYRTSTSRRREAKFSGR